MPKSNTNKVTVLLPNEEFKRFGDYCREHGFKKSTLIARLVRDFLVDAEKKKEMLATSEQNPRRV